MTRSATVNSFLATRLTGIFDERRRAPLRLAGKPFAADQGSRMRLIARRETNYCTKHLFDPVAGTMINNSNSLPLKGGRVPNPKGSGNEFLPTAFASLPCMRTGQEHSWVLESGNPHPPQPNRQPTRHRHYRDRPALSHREPRVRAAPICICPRRNQRCFGQHPAEECVALLGDVSEELTSAGAIFGGDQSRVARHLLPIRKTFGIADDQNVG